MNRVKCEQYWPEPDEEMDLNEFMLRGLGEEASADYITRRFELTLPGAAPREIVQYQFIGWPDFGVPESPRPVLTMLSLVRQRQARQRVAGEHFSALSGGGGRRALTPASVFTRRCKSRAPAPSSCTAAPASAARARS